MKKLLSTLIIGVFLLTGCSNTEVKEDEGVDKVPSIEESNEPLKEDNDIDKEGIDKDANINDSKDKDADSKPDDGKFTEKELIEKAIEVLYQKTGENMNQVSFVHNQDESYVKEHNVKEKYYIFNIVENIDTEYTIIRDYNMLVDKDTYEVYRYNPNTGLEEYYNPEDGKLTEEELIEKAIEVLYQKTEEDMNQVSFVHNQDESYVKEKNIKDEYYIFNIVENIDTEYMIIRDYNMLVDKDTYEVFAYIPEEGLANYPITIP